MTETSRALRLAAALDRIQQAEAQPLPANLGALLDRACERYGDRTCWVQLEADGTPGATLSFAALHDQVARAATVLRARGIGPGARLGLVLNSSPTSVIAWLAAARLGAAIVPVNPRATAAEMTHALRLADVGLALVEVGHRDAVLETGMLAPERIIGHVQGGGDASDWHAALADAAPAKGLAEVAGDCLVNLQFTSGSTGLPKATMLTHDYWLVLVATRAAQGPYSRILIDAPFHYMGGQWRFLLALQTGATVFVAERQSLRHMVSRLHENRIDFCSITPAFAKQPEDPRSPGLAVKWAGTMATPADLVPEVSARLGGAEIREMYGTTETGAIAAMPFEIDWAPGCTGLPVPFRRVSLRDPDGAEVPPGEAGELWVTGPGLMAGYFRNPRATAEVLQDGWFRTGDLCLRDAEGFLRIIGRLKDTVRRSGENISCGEVEAALSVHPAIEEIAVVPRPDSLRGEEVLLCATLADGHGGMGVEQLAAALAPLAERSLAAYKRPRFYAVLSEMPKTASGKIAKARIRDGLEALAGDIFDSAAPEQV